MIYGLILSAGNQTRFKSDKPKSLLDVSSERTLLDVNMSNMEQVCDKVYVVCSTANECWFKTPHKIVIESGKGCGDAVMKALQLLPLTSQDMVFIQWGDSVQEACLYITLHDAYKGRFLIPCQKEISPYVCIVPEGETVRAHFTKYGEVVSLGYHDLSLFYGNALELRERLMQFHHTIDNNGTYTHKHGNEMQFLDVFNETDMPAEIYEVQNYKGFSFNTKKEFEKGVNKLNYSIL